MSLIGNLKKSAISGTREVPDAQGRKRKEFKEYEEFKESGRRGSWLLDSGSSPLLELLILLGLLQLL
jgi:hypothetical protein